METMFSLLVLIIPFLMILCIATFIGDHIVQPILDRRQRIRRRIREITD